MWRRKSSGFFIKKADIPYFYTKKESSNFTERPGCGMIIMNIVRRDYRIQACAGYEYMAGELQK